MNTFIHGHRFEGFASRPARLRQALRGVIAVIATAIVLATILAASILLRLLALPSTHAAIAEAIHRVSEAMGPPF